MKKGNEDLKAKIAKIQQKGKIPVPSPTPAMEVPEQEEEEESMEALQAEFEAKKKALMEKSKQAKAEVPQEQAEDAGEGLDKAIAEYSNQGKFNTEVIFQLVQLNQNIRALAHETSRIAQALESLTTQEE